MYHYMSFTSVYIDEEFIWTINDVDGGLYRIDRINYSIEFMLCVVKDKKESSPDYIKAVGNENKIYFFPHIMKRDIVIYNKKDNTVNYINLPSLLKKSGVGFPDCVIDDDYVYLFPGKIHMPIVRFNLKKEKIDLIYNWYDLNIKKYISHKGPYYVGAALVNHCVWIPIYGTGIIIQKNLNTGSFKIHDLSESGYKFGAIAYDGELFWVALSDSYSMISLCLKSGELQLYSGKDIKNIRRMPPIYTKIICYKQKVFLLSGDSSEIMTVDKSSKTIQSIKDLPETLDIIPHRTFGFFYHGYEIIDEQILICPASGNMILILNPETLKIMGYSLCINNDLLLYHQYYLHTDFRYEDPNECVYHLTSFCDLFPMNSNDYVIKSKINTNHKIGNKIFQYIRSYI